MAQVYKIYNNKNQKIYIGISIAQDGSALSRFSKHLAGEGGVWIKRDLESGLIHPGDFSIEVLEESDDVSYISDREIYYIELFNSLHPNGYNGNKGNYIINTPETRQKAKETRARNQAAGKIYRHKGIHPGTAIYRYQDGSIKSLPTTHEDVINGLAVHINYNPDANAHKKEQNKAEQRARNNGLTDKEALRRELQRALWKYVHTTEWWQRGRETFRSRMERKEFTEKENELYFQRRPKIVKEHWLSVSAEDRQARTKPGLDKMNNRQYCCEYCNIVTNKGNYNRWHGSKCKQRPLI